MHRLLTLALLVLLFPTAHAQESLWLDLALPEEAPAPLLWVDAGAYDIDLGNARQFRLILGGRAPIAKAPTVVFSLGGGLSIARVSVTIPLTALTDTSDPVLIDTTLSSGARLQGLNLFAEARGTKMSARVGALLDLGPNLREVDLPVSDSEHALFVSIGYHSSGGLVRIASTFEVAQPLYREEIDIDGPNGPSEPETITGRTILNVTLAPALVIGPVITGTAAHLYRELGDQNVPVPLRGNDWLLSLTPFISTTHGRLRLHARVGARYEYVDRGIALTGGDIGQRPKTSWTIGGTYRL